MAYTLAMKCLIAFLLYLYYIFYCINCNDVEDEIHFLVYCKLYEESRHIFYQKVARRNSDFLDFTDYEKYIFLMKTTDPFILVWFGKYVFKLFNIRTEHNMMF